MILYIEIMTLSPSSKRKKFVFIDYQNVYGTCKDVLDFEIDDEKLYNHLKKRFGPVNIFFYKGVDSDADLQQEENRLKKLGYIPRLKVKKEYIATKKFTCNFCNKVNIYTFPRAKANCDVDMSFDITSKLFTEINVDFFIFTGDGDFAFLMGKIVEVNENNRVFVFGNKKVKKDKNNKVIKYSTFSKEIEKLINKERGDKTYKIKFVDLEDLKNEIRK